MHDEGAAIGNNAQLGHEKRYHDGFENFRQHYQDIKKEHSFEQF